MSAIGDYVHLNAENYLKYGIKRKVPSDPTSELRAIHSKLRLQATTVKVNKQQVQKLEDEYNLYHSALGSSKDKDIERIRQSIIASLMEKYGKNLSEEVKQSIQFFFGSGDISTLSSSFDTDVQLKQAASLDSVQYSYADSIIKRIDQAERELNKISSAETKALLQQKIDAVKRRLDEAIAATKKTAGDVPAFKGAILKGFSKSSQLVTSKDAQELIAQLNTTLALLKIPNIANWLGAFEEMIAEYCSLRIAGESNEAIANLFEDLSLSFGKIPTQGGMTVDTDFDLRDLVSTNSKLLQSIQKLEKGKLIKNKGGRFIMNFANVTTSKADAYFTIESQSIGASIKNYNMSIPNFDDIHLVQGSPLIYFLMGMKDNKTATHFLNIFAEHEDNDLQSAFINLKSTAAEGLTYQLLYSALSGRGVGRTGGFADLFILNDHSSKGATAKFYDVGTLINAIVSYNKLESVNIKIDNKNLMSFYLSNPMTYVGKGYSKSTGEAIQRRLTALLHDAHKKKVYVSLNKSIFQDSAIKAL